MRCLITYSCDDRNQISLRSIDKSNVIVTNFISITFCYYIICRVRNMLSSNIVR